MPASLSCCSTSCRKPTGADDRSAHRQGRDRQDARRPIPPPFMSKANARAWSRPATSRTIWASSADVRLDRRGRGREAGRQAARSTRRLEHGAQARLRRLVEHLDHAARQADRGPPRSFEQDFLITHFFNPPRYMRLLEVVAGPATRGRGGRGDRARSPTSRLGKSVVRARTRPASSPTASAATGCRRRSTRRSIWA